MNTEAVWYIYIYIYSLNSAINNSSRNFGSAGSERSQTATREDTDVAVFFVFVFLRDHEDKIKVLKDCHVKITITQVLTEISNN